MTHRPRDPGRLRRGDRRRARACAREAHLAAAPSAGPTSPRPAPAWPRPVGSPEVAAPSVAATLDLDGAAGPDLGDAEAAQGTDVLSGRWQAGPRTARHRVVPGREAKPGAPAGEPRRPGRWGAIAAGLAVAAAAAAIFVGALRGGGGTVHDTRAADSVAGAAPRASLIESDHDYTADELAALATQFATRAPVEFGPASPTNAAPAATPPPAPNPTAVTGGAQAPHASSTAAQEVASDPRSCVDQGSGVTSDLPLLYLEAARYEGKDAYIAIYQTQSSSGEPAVLVVAVGRSDCLPLYFGRQAG